VNGRVKTTGAIAMFSLALALAPGRADATDTSAFPGLASPLAHATSVESTTRLPSQAHPQGTFRTARSAVLPANTRAIREQALQGLLSAQEPAFEDAARDGRLELRFHRRGNAFKDLQGSYRDMCARVSQKIWDEPNGKRVRFDVGGKPGFGVEIPLGRSRH
jgi:hypothetical protein